MDTSGPKTKRAIRLIGLAVICLWAFFPVLMKTASAQAAGPEQQGTTGYWKFKNTTTEITNNTTGDGYTWTPSIGENYAGGELVWSAPNMTTDNTTKCSWSFSADTSILKPGQILEITGTVSGTDNEWMSAGVIGAIVDDQLFIRALGYDLGFVRAQQTVDGSSNSASAQATAQGVETLNVPDAQYWDQTYPPEFYTMVFSCKASNGLYQIDTVMHYDWVGAASTPTPTSIPDFNGNQPSDNNPTSETGSGPSIPLLVGGLVTGLLGAILAAAGILGLIMNGRGKGGKNGPMGYYVLQASASSAEVRPGKPAGITFTAIYINDKGVAQPAPQADVRVNIPDTPGRLAAVPPASMGSLACTFSVPNPHVCEGVPVTVVAVVNGATVARGTVQVRILPTYELDLQWEDPTQGSVQVDGQEVRARAWVTAKPPDPEATPDILVQQVNITLQGPNSDWIRQPLKLSVQGEALFIPISAASPAPEATLQTGNPTLVAQFSRGDQQLSARLTVTVNSEAVLGAWINGKKEAQSAYQRSQTPAGWDLPDIIAYFHAPDNEEKPIKPASNYGFDKPPFEANPPILDLVDFYENGDIPDQYVLKVSLKPDTDLDAAFGNVPEDQRQLKVKVFAKDENGKELHDFVTYTFRPMVSFVVHAYEDNPAVEVREHAYRSLKFPDGKELVANGDDTLNLAGYFMRTDLLAKSGPDPAKRLNVGDLEGIEWKLPDDGNYFETSDPEVTDGFVLFNVKSKAPIPASIVKNPEDPTTLVTKPELDQDEGSKYTLESDRVEVDIAVQYPRLHLWVVPGIYRHTSTAIAYLDLLPSKLPLPKQDLCLSVENPDGMELDFDDCDPHQETIDKDLEKAERRGGAFWQLRYSGITWDNMPQAKFKVRAGLEDPPDEVWTAWAEINIYQNLVELLSDMTTDADFSKKVNNPNRDFILPPTPEEMEESMNNSSLDSPNIPIDDRLKAQVDQMNHYAKLLDRKTSTILKGSLPRYLRGPLYNIASCTEKYSFGKDYVCENLRNGICVWLERRRFLHDHEASKEEVLRRLEKMNGLDFGYYSRTPFHVWAGIFPAGADRFSEYRALDPWWYQYWPKEWAQPENLWTQASEDMRLSIFTVLNWVLKLAVITLYSVEQAEQFYEVVNAWLNGTTTDDILNKVIPNTGFRAWWRYVNFDSDNADLDGRYATGRDPEIWSKDLFKNPDPD